jgi:two-component system sensor histidine kinase RpfC
MTPYNDLPRTGDYASPLRRVLESLRTLRQRPDSEHEQSFLRLVIGTAIVTYLSLVVPESSTLPYFSVVFVLIGLMIFVGMLLNPAESPLRRYIGMANDLGMTTCAMIIGESVGAPIYGVYLWVTLGNGFRYGTRYLYTAQVLSLLGFGLVISLTRFWQENLTLALGLLITIAALPIYVGRLLRRVSEAQHRAEQANVAKSQFLSTMTHELRTPLNGILGISDLLRFKRLDADDRELVDMLHSSSRVLLSLIDNVLDVGKIEAGKMTTAAAPFDLHDLIHGLAQMHKPSADNKGLLLKTYIVDNVPRHVVGDSRHLRQVLTNLLGNAVKFTATGKIELRVMRLGATSARCRLRFEVEDTGIGISKQAQQRIFENFMQAEDTTARRYGGTGLGTTIAKQLVELMGGAIGLESEPGKGSMFWFELELAYPERGAELIVAPETRAPRALGLRVLVAEDNLTNQKILRRLLEYAGCSVDIVSTGTAVLEKAKAGGIDVVILDKQMPELNGFEVADALRSDPGLPRVPLVMITAEALVETARECKRHDIQAFLTKPVEAERLFQVLTELAGSRREARQCRELLIDETRLHELGFYMSDRDKDAFYAELIESFSRDARSLIDEMERALGTGEEAVLRQSLHAIEGCARDVGATALLEICRSIRDARSHEAAAQIRNARESLVATKDALLRSAREQGKAKVTQ